MYSTFWKNVWNFKQVHSSFLTHSIFYLDVLWIFDRMHLIFRCAKTFFSTLGHFSLAINFGLFLPDTSPGRYFKTRRNKELRMLRKDLFSLLSRVKLNLSIFWSWICTTIKWLCRWLSWLLASDSDASCGSFSLSLYFFSSPYLDIELRIVFHRKRGLLGSKKETKNLPIFFPSTSFFQPPRFFIFFFFILAKTLSILVTGYRPSVPEIGYSLRKEKYESIPFANTIRTHSRVFVIIRFTFVSAYLFPIKFHAKCRKKEKRERMKNYITGL